MVQLNFDKAKIDVPCPKCGHKTKGQIGRFKRQPDFTCGGCGAAITVDTRKFDEGVRAASAMTDKFMKAIRKL